MAGALSRNGRSFIAASAICTGVRYRLYVYQDIDDRQQVQQPQHHSRSGISFQKNQDEQTGENCRAAKAHRHIAPFENGRVQACENQQRGKEKDTGSAEADQSDRPDSLEQGAAPFKKISIEIGGDSKHETAPVPSTISRIPAENRAATTGGK